MTRRTPRWLGFFLAACCLLVGCGSPSIQNERVCDTSELGCEWDGQCSPAMCKDSFPSAPVCTSTVTLGSLEWTQCDNGDDLNAFCAACYAQDLVLAGHDDWRLPTIDELSTLYQSSDEIIYLCDTEGILNVDPRIYLSCFVAWSSTVENNDPVKVEYVNFGASADRYVNHATATFTFLTRALAVRQP